MKPHEITELARDTGEIQYCHPTRSRASRDHWIYYVTPHGDWVRAYYFSNHGQSDYLDGFHASDAEFCEQPDANLQVDGPHGLVCKAFDLISDRMHTEQLDRMQREHDLYDCECL